MSTFTCAISGIKFHIPALDFISLPSKSGYYHPIFLTSHTSLYQAYSKHCKGELTPTESYLVFLSFLHSSDKINWHHPVSLDPTSPITSKLIENNITQLIAVIEKSNTITHPSFSQPEFSVTYRNSDIPEITNWIEAWETNIDNFYNGIASRKEQEILQKLENKLSSLILSGAKPEQYSGVIASWAARAAEFPPSKEQQYKEIIRTCFHPYKMFTTPLSIIKEVEEFCHCNIEVGSIHFHELCEVLRAGITNHIDYLGGSAPITEYTLLPNIDSIGSKGHPVSGHGHGQEERKETTEEERSIFSILATAPDSPPIESNYSTRGEYIKAKLAYRMKKNTISNKPIPSINI